MKDENEVHDTDLDTDAQITLICVSVLEICVGHTGHYHFQVRDNSDNGQVYCPC